MFNCIKSEKIFPISIESGNVMENLKIKQEPMDSYKEKKITLPLPVNVVSNKTKMDEMRTLINEIEQARSSYFENHLFFKSVKEAACKNNLENLLIAKKAQGIIRAEIVANVTDLNLESKGVNSRNILDLEEHHKNSSNFTLSYCEKIKLSSIVEEKLMNNCYKIQKLNLKKGNDLLHKDRNRMDVFYSHKIEQLKSRDSQLQTLHDTLSTYRNIIQELTEMRQGLLQTVRSEMLPWFEVRCENLELEAKFLERQIYVHMFKENPSIVEAAKRICDSLQKEYVEKSMELEKLKKDEESYESLKGTEYDDILKKYKENKRKIECVNWIASELL